MFGFPGARATGAEDGARDRRVVHDAGSNVFSYTHSIHVRYICLHLVDFYGKCIGKYTSPMDAMSYDFLIC